MIEFLKYSWVLYGLKAPWFSWLAALFLLLWPAYKLINLVRIYQRQSKNLKSAVNHLSVMSKDHPTQFREGLHPTAIEKIRVYFRKNPMLITPWHSFEKYLVFRKGARNEDSVYATESAELTFHEQAILEANFNKRFFLSIPSLVTGTGLLFTFLAILVALLDVHIGDNQQVKGLENLIGGLSGKFVSSVAALFSATIFLFSEKSIFHRLNVKRRKLITAIDNLIPRISPLQVLVEIQRDTSGQSDAFRMFSADLATKLKNSLDQSMGPVLERMIQAIDELNQLTRSSKDEMVTLLNQMNGLLQEAEKGKHETIADQLKILLSNVENAIKSSLSEMGSAFTDSLSGSTMDQFRNISETISGTATLLERMNSQFERSQQELGALINLVKENFERQLSIGELQVTNLAAVLNKLGDDMKKTIEDTTIQSSEVATGIISEAGSISAKSAEILKNLLEKHGTELSRVEELDRALHNTLNNFNNSIQSYSQTTNDLKHVSTEVKNVVSMISQASNEMREGHASMRQIADLTSRQITALAEANEKQREVWQSIQKSMEDYEQLFKKVENNSKSLTNELSRCIESYSNATRNGFEKILDTANNTLGDAVNRLSGSINELKEFLDELSEEISKFNNSDRRQR